MKSLILFTLLFVFITVSCSKNKTVNTNKDDDIIIPDVTLVDANATTETKLLFYNMKQLTEKGVMFGHQDATAYGIGWNTQGSDWMFTSTRSDVKDVCDSHPAVYGWDIGDIGGQANLDGVNFDKMKFMIKQAYIRGGINTISMHIDNPVSGGDAWDVSNAVSEILQEGSSHESYKRTLDSIASFLSALQNEHGEAIPIIFRPYHEHTGSWFWWGQNICTKEEYINLWKFTVEYLRDTKNIHNLLYAYSPSGFISDANYLERYPGDDYVDILGLDVYSLYNNSQISQMTNQLSRLVQLAESKDKIASLAEVGYNMIPITNWWTQYLLKAIKDDPFSQRLSYLLVWRNWTTGHHFAPYPGHASAADFIKFYNDSLTIFEDDLPDVYAP